MNRVIADAPALMNYFVTMVEPDSEVESRYQAEFHDSILAFSPSGERFRFGTELDNLGELIPPENLRDVGYNLAQLYKDQLIFSKDEVVRRAILNISGEDSLHLWTAKRYRELQGRPPWMQPLIKELIITPKQMPILLSLNIQASLFLPMSKSLLFTGR